MKTLLLWALVAVSLGLNVLGLVGLTSPATVAPLTRLLQSGSGKAAGGGSFPSATPAASRRGAAPADTVGAPAKWSELQSDNPATLVANLRAAGYDDRDIRVVLEVERLRKVNERRKELEGEPNVTPWWQNSIGLQATLSLSSTNPQGYAELQKISQDYNQVVESLLGPTPRSAVADYAERRQFGELPPEKVEGVKQILADFGTRASRLRVEAGGTGLPLDRERMQRINEERDKDLRAYLTPEECDNFQLRNSTTANSMRSNLQLFQPTEDEFRKIFALQYAFDQQPYNIAIGGYDAELSRQRAQAQTELTAQIKAALSPERLAEYEKAVDPTYRQAYALVSRLDLPPQNATQLWQLQKATQAQMNTVRYDRNLSVEARNQALTALQSRTISQASDILGGPRGFDAYKSNGGQWIQSMVGGGVYFGGGGGGPAQ